MREYLPNRRQSTSLKFTVDGLRYQCSFSRFKDGRPAEVFIYAGKVGSNVNVMARDLAVVTSLALQYGVPVETIRSALEQEVDGTQRGPLGVLLKLIEDEAKK